MNIKLISPQGICDHSWLTRPNTYLDPQGWFSVDLIVQKNEPEVKRFISDLTEAKMKKLRINDVYSEVFNQHDSRTQLYSLRKRRLCLDGPLVIKG